MKAAQAQARIKELEKALAPFARHHDRVRKAVSSVHPAVKRGRVLISVPFRELRLAAKVLS